jgi:hypothetical protein
MEFAHQWNNGYYTSINEWIIYKMISATYVEPSSESVVLEDAVIE